MLGYINGLYGHERRQAVAALRSLFTWAKKVGVVFRNPATRIRLGKRELAVWQPLTGAQLADAAPRPSRRRPDCAWSWPLSTRSGRARSGRCSSTTPTSAAGGCAWPTPTGRWAT